MSDQDPVAGRHEVTPLLPGCSASSAVVVVQWRRCSNVWEGLVVREVDGKIICAWEPALVMEPIGIAVSPQLTAGTASAG